MNSGRSGDAQHGAVSAREVCRAVLFRLSRRQFAIGASLGSLIGVYYALWAPLPGRVSRALGAVENVATVIVFSALATWLVRWRYRSRLERLLGWLDCDRVPSPEARRGLVELPRRSAIEQLVIVSVFAVALGVWNLATFDGRAAARAFVGIELFGFTFAAIAYLLTEHALRPAYSLAKPIGTGHTIGVAPRFLVAWAVGSGVPLLFLVAIPLRGRSGHQLPPSVPTAFMALTALVTGTVTTVLAARSVAGPLGRVRLGLDAVSRGELDVEVDVEDPGEIGLLQASFNAMVSGLRERQRLQDLFGRHVGEQVARRALQTGPGLGGELRPATILFVDLVGSTALAESTPPEDVVALLNRFFEAVVEVVDDEGGWVDKFEGDAALVVFGIPVSQHDHIRRGLRAARRLHVALEHLGMDHGIGVTSGPVVAGNVGTDRRHEFTVIGRPVNLAARLADLAKHRTERVLAAAEAAAAAGPEAPNWTIADETPIRGIEKPIRVATLSTTRDPEQQ